MKPKLIVALVIALSVGVTPLYGESQKTVVNLRGDQVVVPIDVPPREQFVLQRMISVDDRLVVFLYHDPRFRRPVDYMETYNLKGELLEIAWYQATEGLKRAQDISLAHPKAAGPARILEILPKDRGDGRGPDKVTDNGLLLHED